MTIALVDFGSQYTHLLCRAIERYGYNVVSLSLRELLEAKPSDLEALVLSGGPQSVYNAKYEEKRDYGELKQLIIRDSIPTLGVCYGMQLLGHLFGCSIERGIIGEYGLTRVTSSDGRATRNVWMSHMDSVVPSEAWDTLMTTENGHAAVIAHSRGPLVGVQFHPEVKHTENGDEIIAALMLAIGLERRPGKSVLDIPEVPADFENGIMAFSGGVDSLVAAVHTRKIVGDRLKCVFIDTGLMRSQDGRHISEIAHSKHLDMLDNIVVLDASDKFITALKGISDPETKRKTIGKTFIEVFTEYAKGGNYNYLVQGTINPDRIESSKTSDKSDVIKSHHNVGGLPEELGFKLYEPLMNLYKDDVREYGKRLNIPDYFLHRHPFPGPGLGIRILGEIDQDSITIARHSDSILFEELMESKYYGETWQAFTVVLPIRTVGVKGDNRTYERVVAVRMVNSRDGMTASWTKAPYDLLDKISTRIINEVSGVNRVVYDISNKPASTIEWE